MVNIMEKRSIMITGGAGFVGQYAVDYAVRQPEYKKVYIADVNEVAGGVTYKNAVSGSAIFDKYPDIEFVKLNMLEVDETADILKKLQPSVEKINFSSKHYE